MCPCSTNFLMLLFNPRSNGQVSAAAAQNSRRRPLQTVLDLVIGQSRPLIIVARSIGVLNSMRPHCATRKVRPRNCSAPLERYLRNARMSASTRFMRTQTDQM